MRLATSAQMREMERLTEVEYGMGPEILMETAGVLSAREIQTSFLHEMSQGRLSVVCGPGNNGGDALVVARHLSAAGFSAIRVYLVGDSAHRSPLFEIQLQRLRKHGLESIDLTADPRRMNEIFDSDLIIDGVFGTGLARPVEGSVLEVIKTMNASKAPVVSLDVPSGLSSQTGKILGGCVRASMTLTFGLAKPGLYVADGPSSSGKVRILQIGIPGKLVREQATTHFTFNERMARRWLPVRRRQSNKARQGHLLVVAGHPGMWGAASLCCEGAYRLGAGYVTLAVEKKSDSEKALVKEIGPEVLVSFRQEPTLLEKKTAVAVGPGAGISDDLRRFVERLIAGKFEKVIVDADCLSVLGETSVTRLPPSWIMSPHSGELARLLEVSSQEIDDDRFYFAGLAAQKFGCNVLLKGYRTVVAHPNGSLAVILSGNESLAKAGTGDVLSGFIGGLLAQGIPSFEAACTGAYLHGRLADEWVRRGKDKRSLIPRDLLEGMPELLGALSFRA